MKKQVLSLFMAFVLCFSMLPMSAFARGETGSTEISMNGGETVTAVTQVRMPQAVYIRRMTLPLVAGFMIPEMPLAEFP